MLTTNTFKCFAIAAGVAVNAAAFAISFDTNSDFTFLSGESLGLSNSEALPLLDASDFAAAAAGPDAVDLSGFAGGWIHSLPTDPAADWIGIDPTSWNNSYNSYSALFAYGFDYNSYGHDATLNITFSVDDAFGDWQNEGLYLDGTAIPNSDSNTDWNNQIETKTYDLGVLSGGHHELFFNVYNSGSGPSGMILTGNITSTPAPAALGVFATGLISAFRRRKRA